MEKKPRLCAMAQAPIRADFPRYVDMRVARRLAAKAWHSSSAQWGAADAHDTKDVMIIIRHTS
jgi:hypothetical protein